MKGLKLFIADIIDDDTSEQTFWYVVGRTYDSAFKRFITEANGCYARYSYYFITKNVYTYTTNVSSYSIGRGCIRSYG